jgi:hypothetical protein
MSPDRYHTIITTSNEKLKPFDSKGFHFNTNNFKRCKSTIYNTVRPKPLSIKGFILFLASTPVIQRVLMLFGNGRAVEKGQKLTN